MPSSAMVALRSGILGIGIGLALTGCTPAGGPPSTTPTVPAPSSTTATPAPTSSPTSAAPSPSETPTPTPTPTNTQAPSVEPATVPEIEGTARYGSELSIEEPDWGPGRVELSYQWLRDGEAIDDATDTGYRAVAADIDRSLSVRITGRKAGHTTQVQDTAPVGPVEPGRLKPATPRISGTARVGRTLTGSVDPWGPGEVRLVWQWYRDADKIADATGKTYKLGAADAGHVIKLRVLGSADNFASESRYSEPTGKVGAGLLDPTPVPQYSGIAQVGRTLTALPREWGPGEVKLSYQWYRRGKDKDAKIAGATKVTYKLTAADQDHRLRVRVSGSKAGFETVRRYSGYTSVIDPGDLTGATPTISGTPFVGRTLTADPGEWGPGEVKLVLRWFRSGLLLTRAAGDTYTLSAEDVGQTITVRVIGSKDGYRDKIVDSEPTAEVVARERR